MKKKEYTINRNGTPRILDKKWLEAEFKKMNGIEKILKGWAIVDKRSGQICIGVNGTPLIFYRKAIAKLRSYPHLDHIKKVRIIIEE